MLYVVNYADGEPYESYRKINTKSAYYFGKADKVLEYAPKDIPQSYKNAHKEIFSYKRGAGLWLWKPYIINKVLSDIQFGDWMFYTDGGAIFIRDIHKLIECAEFNNTDIMLFEQPLLHRQFTKHETMVQMGIVDNDANQTLGIFLLQKTNKTVALMSEWLQCCECEDLLSPAVFYPEIKEYTDFVAHREDQSILSALRIKNGITTFRDPSDYGEMPFQYATSNKFLYRPIVYDNSTYPTILLCSRSIHPYRYFILYIIRLLLSKLSIRWTELHFLNRFKSKKISLC